MNVIIVCLDTLRWDSPGCYGNRRIQTPALDAFAKDATRFDGAYVGSFPTVPMRTDAFTGNVNWPVYGWKPLGEDEVIMTQCLREAGYHTAFVHDTWNMRWAGFGEQFDDDIFIGPPEGWENNLDKVQYPVPRENIRGNAAEFTTQRAQRMHYQHETDWFGVRTMLSACEWLEDNYQRDKFFLWVDSFEIHENWRTPDYYTEYYSPDYEGLDYSFPNYHYTDIYQPHELQRMVDRYSAEVTMMDRWLGHLLRQIETMRLLDNTMLLILSDHGVYIGEHKRAGKHTIRPDDPWPIYDELGRLPWLMRLPGRRKRKRVAALVQPADIMPTVLDVCAVKGPKMYGKSLVPLLTGKAERHHDYVFTSFYSGEGEGRIPDITSCITVTGPRWTLVTGPESWQPTLHDRQEDPRQKLNIIKHHPRIAAKMCGTLVKFMRKRGADEDYIQQYATI